MTYWTSDGINGSGEIQAQGDMLFDAATLPDASGATKTKDSAEFDVNDGLQGIEIIGNSVTAIGAVTLLIYTLYSSDTPGVTDSNATDTQVLYSATAAIDANTEFFRFAPTVDVGAFGFVRITAATTDRSAETCDVWVHAVANRPQ